MLKRALRCFTVCLLHFTLLSQTLKFEQYTTKDGLPSNETYNLHQDKQGYIWVFTNYGALKYNGREFKPVLKNLPFNESFIYSFYENEKGQKWIANSHAKIYEVINDSAFILKGTKSISEQLRQSVEEIYQLYVDDSLNVFIITKASSYKLVPKNRIYSVINLSQQINTIAENYKIFEKAGFLFPVRRYEKRIAWDSVMESFSVNLQTSKGHLVFKQRCIKFARLKYMKKYGDDIYFNFYNTLGKITGMKTISTLQMNTHIQNFVKDKSGHTWLACYNDGLIELNEKDSIVNRYFKNTAINDILIDAEDGLWVSSVGGGLFYCRNLSSLYFKDTEPLGSNIAITKIIDDTLYIATSKGDFYTVKNDELAHVKKSDNKNNALDFIKSGPELFISYVQKIDHLHFSEPGKLKTINTFTTTSNPIKVIALGKNRLLCASRNLITLLINGKAKKILKFNQKIYSFELRNKLLFLATDKGIYLLPDDRREEFFSPLDTKIGHLINLIQPAWLRPSKNSVIRKIIPDNAGNLWFCSTGNGLFILKPNNRLLHITTRAGLPSDIINNISFYRDSCILLSTNKGLFMASVNNNYFQNLSWKKIFGEEITNALGFENKIYSASTKGLLIFDLTKIDQKEKIHFNLSSIRINAKEINRDALKNLRYEQNNLDFTFDIVSFADTRHAIEYQLSGAVNEITIAENNTIKFKNLPAGNYTLTAFPSFAKELPISVAFCIVPAFWQTKLFMAALSILLIALIFFFTRLSVLNFKKKEIKKLQAERLISEYRLTALKAQFNPHFMSNCLSAIQNLIYTGHVDKAGQYLAKFSVFMRKILDHSEKHYLSLTEEIAVIESYVELERLRFKNVFNFQLHVQKSAALNDILIPALVTQPFIENAIWHGLLPLQGRTPQLTVTIFEQAGKILITIEDNGVGRDKSNLPKTRNSKGTKLSVDKIESMNQLSDAEHTIEITDLFDKNNAPCGTRVTLHLSFLNLDA